MKKLILIFIIFKMISLQNTFAEEYSLESCLEKAVNSSEYTKMQRYEQMLEEKEKTNLSNLYLPQLSLDASASYQSEKFKMDIKLPIPGIQLPEGKNESYQASLLLTQLIYEGGYIAAAKESKEIEKNINLTSLKVSNQKIKEAVNDLYFNILIIQDNIKVIENAIETLQIKSRSIRAGVENGVLLKTNLQLLEIEILKMQQKTIQLNSDKESLLKMLAILIDDDKITSSVLTSPNISIRDEDFNSISFSSRPEFELFENKSKLYDSKKEEINSKILPSISAFVKAGAGSPNPFNMMETDLSFFYQAGVKFQWTVWDWFNNSRTRETGDIKKEINTLEKINFERSLDRLLTKDKSDISKFKNLIRTDMQIIESQKDILKNYEKQMLEGTMSINDYLAEYNNLLQSDINLKIHSIQLLNAKYNLLIKSSYNK